MSSSSDTELHRRERRELLIPWALDREQRLVAAAAARRGSEEYHCPNPACAASLIVKAGGKRVRHFAHRGKASCRVETALHWAAKHRIADVVFDWVRGGPVPMIRRQCPRCNNVRFQPLPESVRGTRIEMPLGDLRPDVTLVDERGEAVAAIEVYVTHPVREPKAKRFSGAWIELEAEAILSQPYEWFPRQQGNLRELRCDHVPPYKQPEPGEYFVVLVGERQEWTARYRSLGHAAQVVRLYLRKYFANRALKVIIDATDCRHFGSWDGCRWTRSPALADRDSLHAEPVD